MLKLVIGGAVFLPLLGFAVNGLFGKKIRNETIIGIIGSATVAAAFAVACIIFLEMLGAPPEERRFSPRHGV